MKIAIIGTHGVGKTTLAQNLAKFLKEKGKSVGILHEIARKCPLPINKETSLNSQLWILVAQIKEEIESQSKFEHVVCDRSVLDPFIYLVNKIGYDNANYWETFVLEHLKTYDLLIKLPLNKKYLVKDGIRDVDERFQEEVEVLLNSFLEKKQINCIRLEPNKPYLQQLLFYLEALVKP